MKCSDCDIERRELKTFIKAIECQHCGNYDKKRKEFIYSFFNIPHNYKRMTLDKIAQKYK